MSGPRKSYEGNETGDMVESDGEMTSDTVVRGELVTGSLSLKGQSFQLAAGMSFGQSTHGLSLGGMKEGDVAGV